MDDDSLAQSIGGVSSISQTRSVYTPRRKRKEIKTWLKKSLKKSTPDNLISTTVLGEFNISVL